MASFLPLKAPVVSDRQNIDECLDFRAGLSLIHIKCPSEEKCSPESGALPCPKRRHMHPPPIPCAEFREMQMHRHATRG